MGNRELDDHSGVSLCVPLPSRDTGTLASVCAPVEPTNTCEFSRYVIHSPEGIPRGSDVLLLVSVWGAFSLLGPSCSNCCSMRPCYRKLTEKNPSSPLKQTLLHWAVCEHRPALAHSLALEKWYSVCFVFARCCEARVNSEFAVQ